MNFQLTNNDRQYLGLNLVKEHWDLVQLTPEIWLYFDEHTIKKRLSLSENCYQEDDMNEITSDNRALLLPKTKRGKAKKLNYSSLSKRNGIGVYFSFCSNILTIANYTTQITFFSTKVKGNVESLRLYLDTFIAETSNRDMQELKIFKAEKRKRVKYKEGDFFKFKIGRRTYGYGRILMNVTKYRKTDAFKQQKNYGLAQLMGVVLQVKIYHFITDNQITLQRLKKCKAIPSEYIMDNKFFYGEYEIIGHLPLEKEEMDFIISYGRSISGGDRDTVYLQYGLEYKECSFSEFNEYLTDDFAYRNEGTGFGLAIDDETLKKCIEFDSNTPYWNDDYYRSHDLRHPENKAIKIEIFKYFDISE
ncbi:hypothetical protein MNBD_GAMMA12-81 [hydrothermal vent metagenome]|uniref:Immunity protein 26 n=1 Tax=hydrothermal vent metagenome TaxID=652676 RepID=A0A3B0Y8E3_9ZZZZ